MSLALNVRILVWGEELKVLVSGSTGLIGSALVQSLAADGHQVARLRRRPAGAEAESICWDPDAGEIDARGLEGFDAVVHLAGENVASGRWTQAKKRAIRNSRVGGTQLLCQALAGLRHRPRTLVCASAVGFYGSRGSEELDEASAAGEGFLPEVCCSWEAATGAARAVGIRVVNLRIGVVFTTKGGSLARMLPLFRAGLGGIIGSGSQYVSWIALDDVAGSIRHVLLDGHLSGPVNAVSPEAATNRELTMVLGRLLRRAALLRVPALVVRLALGEMGKALLLASARVVPRRLLASGYEFCYPGLEGALRHLLGVPL